MSMTRLILTDDAFHGGEPLPAPYVRIDAHAPPPGGLYRSIPNVTAPTAPTAVRDAPAGEALPAHPISPAGNLSRDP